MIKITNKSALSALQAAQVATVGRMLKKKEITEDDARAELKRIGAEFQEILKIEPQVKYVESGGRSHDCIGVELGQDAEGGNFVAVGGWYRDKLTGELRRTKGQYRFAVREDAERLAALIIAGSKHLPTAGEKRDAPQQKTSSNDARAGEAKDKSTAMAIAAANQAPTAAPVAEEPEGEYTL